MSGARWIQRILEDREDADKETAGLGGVKGHGIEGEVATGMQLRVSYFNFGDND